MNEKRSKKLRYNVIIVKNLLLFILVFSTINSCFAQKLRIQQIVVVEVQYALTKDSFPNNIKIKSDTVITNYDINGNVLVTNPTPNDVHFTTLSRPHRKSKHVYRDIRNNKHKVEFWSDQSIKTHHFFNKGDSTIYIHYSRENVEPRIVEKVKTKKIETNSYFGSLDRSAITFKILKYHYNKKPFIDSTIIILLQNNNRDSSIIVTNRVTKAEKIYNFNPNTLEWFVAEKTKKNCRKENTIATEYDVASNSYHDYNIIIKFDRKGNIISETKIDLGTKAIVSKKYFSYSYY